MYNIEEIATALPPCLSLSPQGLAMTAWTQAYFPKRRQASPPTPHEPG